MQHDRVRVTVHTSFEAENKAEERAARFAFFFVIEVDDFSIALPIAIDDPDPGNLETIRQTAIQDFRMLVHQIADAPVANGVTALKKAHDISIDA
ncbi:hypothetical protein [Roseibium sp.]|uniref:hypothetical protein n=1 Tax=Roseibium sp. TaxID=1936156 RepID=UPI003BAAE648